MSSGHQHLTHLCLFSKSGISSSPSHPPDSLTTATPVRSTFNLPLWHHALFPSVSSSTKQEFLRQLVSIFPRRRRTGEYRYTTGYIPTAYEDEICHEI